MSTPGTGDDPWRSGDSGVMLGGGRRVKMWLFPLSAYQLAGLLSDKSSHEGSGTDKVAQLQSDAQTLGVYGAGEGLWAARMLRSPRTAPASSICALMRLLNLCVCVWEGASQAKCPQVGSVEEVAPFAHPRLRLCF